MYLHRGSCQAEREPGQLVCHQCGSTDLMVAIFTSSGIRVSIPADLKLKDAQHKTGPGRFLRHDIKHEYSHDRQRMEFVERRFDRVNRTYDEFYYDSVSGVVVFETHESINDQSIDGYQRNP